MAATRWTAETGAAHAVALEVLINGPISRSDIARRLDLSPGSLTRLSTPLIESGLLIDTGERPDGRAGRPSRLLDIVPTSRHFIGLKITGDEVLGASTDLRATLRATASRPLLSRDPESVVATAAAVVSELSATVPSVEAIGVGIGALVTDDGLVSSAPFLGWSNVPIAKLLEERTGLPVAVDNDLTAFTEYENWFGAARTVDRFAVVTLGAGVGYGLVVGGSIVVGPDSGIGLVGHWPLDPFGAVCSAGHRGCAQSMLTVSAISTSVSAALGRDVTYDAALDAAAAGEPAARRIIDDAGRGLGRLLAAVANLTVPELIVLGGEGVRLAAIAADAVAEGMRADRDPRSHEVELIATSGDDVEWCRGAAVLAIQTYVLGRL